MFEDLYETLLWDTEIFGYKVGRLRISTISPVKLKELLHYLKENKYRLLYWSVNPNNLFLNLFAEQAGGILVDEKLTYNLNLPTQAFPLTSFPEKVKTYAQQKASADLLELAWQSGYCSRFNRDLHFKNNEFQKLYTSWLQNSLNKKIAREVLVYKAENKIIGFITLAEQYNVGQIGLLAIANHVRRSGMGQQLLTGAIHKFSEWNCSQVRVITQHRNRPATRFYEKFGFILEKKENVYHFWL